jgi:hypothetical protein
MRHLLMSLGQFYIEARSIEHPSQPIIPDTFFWVSGNFLNLRECRPKHERYVIDMNEVRCRASGRVQREAASFEGTVDEPGNLAGSFVIPFEGGDTMLKTISAALLAVSVLAAPALAASTDKTTQAPASKSAQVNKASQANKSALNANARMGGHHVRHSGHHKKMMTHKSHKSPKVAAKRFAPPAKRG